MLVMIIVSAWTLSAALYLGMYKSFIGPFLDVNGQFHMTAAFGMVFAPIGILVILAYLLGLIISFAINEHFKINLINK